MTGIIGLPSAGRGEHGPDDVVVAGAPAQVAFERRRGPRSSVGGGSRLSSETVAITMPGVQKPHCSPCSAWKARCTGCISPSSPSARPSTVGPRAPSACAASTVHDFDRLPVQQDRAGPAGAGVAADVGRGEAGHVAQEVHEQRAVRAPRLSTCAAVDGHGRPSLGSPLASLIAVQTRSGVVGMSMCRTPRWLTASMTAFWMAGVAPIVPASPIPLTPSGLGRRASRWSAARSWAARPR